MSDKAAAVFSVLDPYSVCQLCGKPTHETAIQDVADSAWVYYVTEEYYNKYSTLRTYRYITEGNSHLYSIWGCRECWEKINEEYRLSVGR